MLWINYLSSGLASLQHKVNTGKKAKAMMHYIRDFFVRLSYQDHNCLWHQAWGSTENLNIVPTDYTYACILWYFKYCSHFRSVSICKNNTMRSIMWHERKLFSDLNLFCTLYPLLGPTMFLEQFSLGLNLTCAQGCNKNRLHGNFLPKPEKAIEFFRILVDTAANKTKHCHSLRVLNTNNSQLQLYIDNIDTYRYYTITVWRND